MFLNMYSFGINFDFYSNSQQKYILVMYYKVGLILKILTFYL